MENQCTIFIETSGQTFQTIMYNNYLYLQWKEYRVLEHIILSSAQNAKNSDTRQFIAATKKHVNTVTEKKKLASLKKKIVQTVGSKKQIQCKYRPTPFCLQQTVPSTPKQN